MRIQFLIDKNLSPDIKYALRRLDPAIDIIRVEDEDAPPEDASDAEIFRFAEDNQRMIVTGDRRSFPGEIFKHLATDHHHWGVVWLRPDQTIWRLVEDLYFVWQTSEAEEWIDQTLWLPFE